MKAIYKGTVTVVSYFFILLLVYAAVSKMRDFENFQVQLAQSPLLSAYAGIISYGVILLELLIALVLAFPKGRKVGLYASFGLMVAFTVYIYLILYYSDFVPCSCGGILEKMGWTEHLVFNVAGVVMAFMAIVFIEKEGAIHFRRTAAWSSLILVISVGGMVALFLSSEYIMKKENNFTRRFVPHPIAFSQRIDLLYNSFYFAGQHGDTIFLGNKVAPLILGTINPSFDKMKLDTLQLNRKSPNSNTIKLQVRYPYFSMSDGRLPLVFEGELPNLKMRSARLPFFRFSKSLMTEPHQYIFRGQSTQTGESIMGLLVTKPDVHVQYNTSFLEKQIDGVFDTDGDFVYDPLTRKSIYTYYYRNEYRILDSVLRYQGSGRTIDTISKAKLRLVSLKNGQTKMAAPPLKVNLQQATFGGLLFNVSNLKGQYESRKMWTQASVIDVYDYRTGTYQYSFYINHEKKNKIKEIMVSKQYLYFLTGNYLIRYQRMYAPYVDGQKQAKPKTWHKSRH